MLEQGISVIRVAANIKVSRQAIYNLKNATAPLPPGGTPKRKEGSRRQIIIILKHDVMFNPSITLICPLAGYFLPTRPFLFLWCPTWRQRRGGSRQVINGLPTHFYIRGHTIHRYSLLQQSRGTGLLLTRKLLAFHCDGYNKSYR
jgi:hypothetical protein